VGVGTDNPSHRLTVSGTWRDGQAAGTDLTHTGILSIRSDRPQLDFIDTDATNKDWAIHVNDSKMFFIRSPWDDANLVLDGAGNVGIGSQAPSHRLTIEGAWSDRQATGSDLTKAGQLSIRSNAPQLDFVDTDANHKDWAIHVNNNKMYFIRSPWEYSDLLLDGTGNVGIGTDAPTVKLHVAGSVRVDSDLTVVGTLSASGGFISSVWFATGNGPIEDGDSGRIQSRTLTIKKKFADTVVRILYCDNFRVLGSESNASARWEIRVNGASLSTPIIADRYSIDNIHTNGMVMGFARGLAAGTHEIQVWVGATPGNIVCNSATGWNSSTWSLAAEEIRQA
ncbi:MAG: hypothetical protein VKP63_07745, partial [Cyanobacteriota bacterium]|nr:hypothetical protein [Cyanobacteriota bacterium]